MALIPRAAAWLNLAYRFALHVTWRMPQRALLRSSDLPRFRAALQAEGYLPLLPAERAIVPAAMRCINCGLCALACSDGGAPADAWAEPWTFVAGPSRAIDRAPLAAAALPSCALRSDVGAVCPTGVPIAQLANLVRRMDT
jgi:ferredoxin